MVFHKTKDSKYTVLVSHGNAEDITESLRDMRSLARSLHVNICQFEYPGYSWSSGTPSEYRVYAAADAALDALLKEGIKKEKIIVFGRSIGSGPAVDIASRRGKFAGLVLQSPLTSAVGTVVPDFMALLCICCCLPCCDTFRNIHKIKNVSCPVYIIHGTKDRVVPPRNGAALYSRVKGPGDILWVDGAGHNDVEMRMQRKYVVALKTFIMMLEGPVTSGVDLAKSKTLNDDAKPSEKEDKKQDEKPEFDKIENELDSNSSLHSQDMLTSKSLHLRRGGLTDVRAVVEMSRIHLQSRLPHSDSTLLQIPTGTPGVNETKRKKRVVVHKPTVHSLDIKHCVDAMEEPVVEISASRSQIGIQSISSIPNPDPKNKGLLGVGMSHEMLGYTSPRSGMRPSSDSKASW